MRTATRTLIVHGHGPTSTHSSPTIYFIFYLFISALTLTTPCQCRCCRCPMHLSYGVSALHRRRSSYYQFALHLASSWSTAPAWWHLHLRTAVRRLHRADQGCSRQLTDLLSSYGLHALSRLNSDSRPSPAARRRHQSWRSSCVICDVVDVGLSDHSRLRWTATLHGSPFARLHDDRASSVASTWCWRIPRSSTIIRTLMFCRLVQTWRRWTDAAVQHWGHGVVRSTLSPTTDTRRTLGSTTVVVLPNVGLVN